MSHLEEGLLHAVLDGEIPSQELAPIQAHLASCAECRSRLEQESQLLREAEGLVEALEVPAGEAGSRPAPGHTVRPPWGRRLAWAASLLAAVGLGYFARGVAPPASTPAVQVSAAARPSDSGSVLGSTSRRAEEPSPAIPPRVAPRRATASPAVPPPGRAPVASPAAAPKLEEKNTSTALDATVAGATIANSSLRADSAIAAREGQAAPASAIARRNSPALGRLREGVAFAQLKAAPQPALAPPEPVSLPDAVRRLGGSLRLVDGLVPLRLEAQGQTIRVVYAVAQGELVLSQQLIDGRVAYQLIAPAGFSADSLAKLRSRVRE